jgi:hypothetical protein
MLSLPGRINIAKSMLYSQLNYLGSFIKIPDNLECELETIITDFVKGPLNIAKKRMFRSVEDGGLGLFDIKNFLGAQQCSWIKRSLDLNEQWKVLLYKLNHGHLINPKADNIRIEEYPILRNICKNFENFSNNYTTVNENFKRCFILKINT